VISKTEREAFTARLREALRNAKLKDTSPTILQRNLSVIGVHVTVHATRKWLLGEAIPTQDKLNRIAAWLGVQPDWLRYGTGAGATTAPAGEIIAPHLVRMLAGFGRLAERDQMLVQAMVDNMLQTARREGGTS
jgi:transcriptional regulator with XRE-family HTH domain